LVQDRTKTPPSSPVLKEEKEFTVHSDPIMSLVSHIVTSKETSDSEVVEDIGVIVDDPEVAPCPEGSKVNVSKDSKTPDDQESMEIVSLSKEENLKLKDKEVAESKDVPKKTTEDTQENQKESTGFLTSIKQKIGGFFSYQADTKSEDEQEVEEVIEGEEESAGDSSVTLPKEPVDKLPEQKPALPEQTDKKETSDETQITNLEVVEDASIVEQKESPKSLDSTYASGYHFDTPPHMSLESEIQPCAVDGNLSARTTDTTNSDGPFSIESKLLSSSSDVAFSETSSSDYKVLTNISSISTETKSKNTDIIKDIAAVDSSTEDQMSSGNFSIEDSSPRYAELPAKLTKVTGDNTEPDEDVSKLGRKHSGKLLSMDTRSTSITSDVSDQEIPPTTPRSDLTSPTPEGGKFSYGDKCEKFTSDTVDIMTQSIYVPSGEGDQLESLSLDLSNKSMFESILQTTEVITTTVTTEVTETTKDSMSVETVEEKTATEVRNGNEMQKEIHTESVTTETSTSTTTKTFDTVSEEVIEKPATQEMSLVDIKTTETQISDGNSKLSPKETTTSTDKKGAALVKELLSSPKKEKDSTADCAPGAQDDKKADSPAEKESMDVKKAQTCTSSKEEKTTVSSDKPENKESSSKAEELPPTKEVTTTKREDTSKKDDQKDPIADWGKPLGLPSPIRPGTPRHSKKHDDDSNDTNKLKDSVQPVWMDLAYVPHHGCKNYVNAEFFKRVRARYYVFSGVEPSKDVFNALLEAKKTWENKDQEVTIIPTYDTDVLGYWVAENEDLLTELKIDLAPSASRCTINLQDHETSCAAYRLEF